MFLRNPGVHVPDYMMSQAKTPQHGKSAAHSFRIVISLGVVA
jgi:hypothetical protein